jgi:hypothetical protein
VFCRSYDPAAASSAEIITYTALSPYRRSGARGPAARVDETPRRPGRRGFVMPRAVCGGARAVNFLIMQSA